MELNGVLGRFQGMRDEGRKRMGLNGVLKGFERMKEWKRSGVLRYSEAETMKGVGEWSFMYFIFH